MYLGYAYLNGKGIAVDYAKAENFLEPTIKKDEPSVMNYLEAICFDGKEITKDQNKSIPLLQKICSADDSNAGDKLKEIKTEK